MTIGETLKRARKKMNLELDDVASSTKIAKMFIIALENDDISSLPKGVYTRIFLRTYARLLKLDEDIITTEYHEQFSVKSHFVAQKEQTRRDNMQYIHDRNKAVLIFLLLILLPVIGAISYFAYGDEITAKFDQWMGKSPAVVAPTSTEEADAQILPKTQEPVVSKSVPQDADGETIGDIAKPEPVVLEDTPPMEETTPADLAEETDAGAIDVSEPLPEATDFDPEEPVVVGSAQVLPVKDVASIAWTPEGRKGSLADMFAIESLARVWVKVIIDGEIVTERFLFPGTPRYYRYGETHSVVIGMTNRVAVQSGEVFREKAHDVNSLVVAEFGPGGFLDALDVGVAKVLARQKE